jgi:hypothetical protein
VARIPRDIGTSRGVNETLTSASVSRRRFWMISGVCRWVPPTPYALAEAITSEPSRCGLGALPAPEVPEAATTTMPAGSTSPAATAGASARVDTVG